MNCKQGDIAIVISGKSTGLAVTCVKLATVRDFIQLGGLPAYDLDQQPVWVVDKPVIWREALGDQDVPFALAPDQALRPITPPEDMVEETDEETLHV